MIKLFYYRHNIKQTQIPITLQNINFFELTVVFDGKLEYIVNGTPYCVCGGDIIFLKNGCYRQRKASSGVDYISINFFSEDTFDYPTLFQDGVSEIVRPILQAMDNIYQYTNNLDDERFTLLLSCLLKQLETQLKIEKEHPLVLKIKNYIKNNISQKITLAAISEHTFFSAVHCEMIFKQKTGLSIIEYVLKQRILIAKSLLMEGSLTLTKISEIVGFSDYNYFSRTFKKQTGYTPLAYKKNASKFLNK